MFTKAILTLAGHLHGKLHLTKIVTLMPYFLVRNLTQRPLRFMQENDKVELWYDIPPQQVCLYVLYTCM